MPSNIQIRYSIESDAPALGQLNIDSFKHHQYWKNAFPNIEPAATFPLKQARALEKMTAPDVHILSALDGEKIVGYSRWRFPGSQDGAVELSDEAKAKIASVESLLPEGANKQIYENFFVTLKELRKVHANEEDISMFRSSQIRN